MCCHNLKDTLSYISSINHKIAVMETKNSNYNQLNPATFNSVWVVPDANFRSCVTVVKIGDKNVTSSYRGTEPMYIRVR